MKTIIPRRNFPALRWLLLSALALLSLPARAEESSTDAPATLVIAYRAEPAMRAAFLAHVAQELVPQLESWKAEGVFQSYEFIKSAWVNASSQDGFVFLHFGRTTDLRRWRQIETTRPGGLSSAGLALARPTYTYLADTMMQMGAPAKNPAESFYSLNLHVVGPEYRKYPQWAKEYLTPLIDGYIAGGALTSFRLYKNQNYTGAEWAWMLVFEYRGMEGFALHESVQQRLRAELGKNPTWQAWYEARANIRSERGATLGDRVLPAGR
jgi:hypothetical protein